MVLTRIFDKVMDLKGDFEVLEFSIGKMKKDYSYARLLIHVLLKHLNELLESLYIEGAQPASIDQVILEPARKNMVMPTNFYSTTNNTTQIYYKGSWITVENMMMDKCIVVDTKSNQAECKMIRDIKEGEIIVIGESGIK